MRPDRFQEICQRLAEDVNAASVLILSDDGRELARTGDWDEEPSLRAISRFALGERAIVVIGWATLPPLYGVDRAITAARDELTRAA
jgi:hypothetical protein